MGAASSILKNEAGQRSPLSWDIAQQEHMRREPYSGAVAMDALGKALRTFRGDPRPKISHAKNRNADWLAEQASRDSAKRIADKTGLTPKAIENIRQRKNKISFDNFVEWCQNDPDLAAAFAEHVGLILPGEAEYAGAITKAINAYVRRPPRTD